MIKLILTCGFHRLPEITPFWITFWEDANSCLLWVLNHSLSSSPVVYIYVQRVGWESSDLYIWAARPIVSCNLSTARSLLSKGLGGGVFKNSCVVRGGAALRSFVSQRGGVMSEDSADESFVRFRDWFLHIILPLKWTIKDSLLPTWRFVLLMKTFCTSMSLMDDKGLKCLFVTRSVKHVELQ